MGRHSRAPKDLKKKYTNRIRTLRKAGIQITPNSQEEVNLLLQIVPSLVAEDELDKEFSLQLSEDRVYDLAMQAFNDEQVALKLVKAFADSKVPN